MFLKNGVLSVSISSFLSVCIFLTLEMDAKIGLFPCFFPELLLQSNRKDRELKIQEVNLHNFKTLFVFLVHGIWNEIEAYLYLCREFPVRGLPLELVAMIMEYDSVPYIMNFLISGFHSISLEDWRCEYSDRIKIGERAFDLEEKDGRLSGSLTPARVFVSWHKSDRVSLERLEQFFNDNVDIDAVILYVMSFLSIRTIVVKRIWTWYSNEEEYNDMFSETVDEESTNSSTWPSPLAILCERWTTESLQVKECRNWCDSLFEKTAKRMDIAIQKVFLSLL